MPPITRGKKILELAKNTADQSIIEFLEIPRYESTKGTNQQERLTAIASFQFDGCLKPIAVISPIKEPEEQNDPFSDSGSEYLPGSDSSDTDHEDSPTSIQQTIEITENQESTQPQVTISNNNSINPESLPITNTSTVADDRVMSISIQQTSEITENQNSTQPQVTISNNNSTNPESSPIINTSIVDEDGEMSSEEENPNRITINPVTFKEGKRIRDKVHACYICNQLFKNNLSRHYKRAHANETEIERIFSITDMKKRREKLKNLARCGDFYHNCEVLSFKKGELILARRPSQREFEFSNYCDYGPCPECLGFMLKRHIWHHLKYNCQGKEKDDSTTNELENCNKRSAMAESSALINGILSQEISSAFLHNIINKFKNDAISEICKNDPSIVRFGAFMYEKYSTTQCELIRQNMRQLGRLISEVQLISNNKISSLSDLLLPTNFDIVVLATKSLCDEQQQTSNRPEFEIPSLAMKLGYSLKKCISIERGQALRRGDVARNKQLLAFLTLLKIEWSVRISSNAKATLESRKLNATDLLPLTSDLVKLRSFLDSSIQKTRSEMLQTFDKTHWVNLASLVLVRIILFNKRRSGEASKITMQQYATRPSWENTGTEEMKNSLTSFERELASNLTLVQVIGKRGRRVPIILSEEMKAALDQLILFRVKAGVDSENPFIFAIPGTASSHMRGHDCVKKWCLEAQLQSPDLITGTKLRKYVATVCQVFDLSENEQDWLARHLGHDIRVHREFYRLQENAVELTKVSRLLLAVDQGEVQNFSGKKLKDINIEDLPVVEETNCESDKESEDENLEPEKENTPSYNMTCNSQKNGKKLSEKHKGRGGKKKPWSVEEKELVLGKMRPFIKKKSLPGKEICSKLLEDYPILESRKWTDIKFFVKNHISRINKTV